MDLGRILISNSATEAWLRAHCQKLYVARSPEHLDKIMRERPEIINCDAIVLPTGWWTQQHAINWRKVVSRPAVIAVSSFKREGDNEHLFRADVVTSLAFQDDCIPTDYNSRELLARIRAIRSRTQFHVPMTSIIVSRDERIEVDLINGIASVDGNRLNLTPTEKKIIVSLARQQGNLISKTTLCEMVFGIDRMEELEDCIRLIDVLICKLRKKFTASGVDGLEVIGTVHWRGYMFDIPRAPKTDRTPKTRRGPRKSWNAATQTQELVNA